MSEITVKIEDHLTPRLQRAFPAILGRARQLVEREGLRLAGRVQEHLKEREIYDTGTLRKSVHSVSTVGPTWAAATVASNVNYAKAVHEGRKPGTPPPVSVLEEWVRRRVRQGRITLDTKKGARRKKGAKLSPKDQEIRGIAYAIQASIRKEGTRSRPFFDEVQALYAAGIKARVGRGLAAAVKAEVSGG